MKDLHPQMFLNFLCLYPTPQEKYLTSDEKLLSMTYKDGPLFQALKNYVQLYAENLSGQMYIDDGDDEFDTDFDSDTDSEAEPVLKGSD